MQMLFQADIGKQTPDQVRATFWKSGDQAEPEVRGFAEDLFRVAVAHQEQIDELIVANSRIGGWSGCRPWIATCSAWPWAK